MQVRENPDFTRDYFDPGKRYIGNSVQIFFADGSKSRKVSIDFPIGHRKRRAEGIPVLLRKFEQAIREQLPERRVEKILRLAGDPDALDQTPLSEWMGLFAN